MACNRKSEQSRGTFTSFCSRKLKHNSPEVTEKFPDPKIFSDKYIRTHWSAAGLTKISLCSWGPWFSIVSTQKIPVSPTRDEPRIRAILFPQHHKPGNGSSQR